VDYEIVDWDDDGVALVDESPVHPADLSVLLELCETDRAEGLLETVVDPVQMRLLAALEDDGRPLSIEQLAARLSAHDGGGRFPIPIGRRSRCTTPTSPRCRTSASSTTITSRSRSRGPTTSSRSFSSRRLREPRPFDLPSLTRAASLHAGRGRSPERYSVPVPRVGRMQNGSRGEASDRDLPTSVARIAVSIGLAVLLVLSMTGVAERPLRSIRSRSSRRSSGRSRPRPARRSRSTLSSGVRAATVARVFRESRC